MRKFSVSSVVLLLLALGFSSTTAAERPDIILMMSDHHGWEETGYNGQPLPDRPLGGIDLMPFIDGLLGPVRILIR